jgi:hypothetical protein
MYQTNPVYTQEARLPAAPDIKHALINTQRDIADINTLSLGRSRSSRTTLRGSGLSSTRGRAVGEIIFGGIDRLFVKLLPRRLFVRLTVFRTGF